MPILELKNVAKSYGQGRTRTEVLDNIHLSVEEGEFVAIVGFSGSGKTTLISLMAGLAKPDSGSLTFDGKPISGASPERGVIFQNYSLLPWLTVYQNVALAVDNVFPTWSASKRDEQVRHYLDMVSLTPALKKKPHELSGGMRQRVSVARALAMSPRLLLLDEPLGALDALTRGTLQTEIERIIAADRRTAVLITNDVDEAILLADRIIPLKPGPRATLGQEFEVHLARPRVAAELNQDPEFKRIRNELTGYLVDCRTQLRQDDGDRPSRTVRVRLPAVSPIDVNAA